MEVVQVEGLGQELICPAAHGLHDVLGLSEGGHQHDAEGRMHPLGPFEQLQPAETRQAQVRHQDFEGTAFQGLQCLLGIAHGQHVPGRPRQRLHQQTPEGVLVLDQQETHGTKVPAFSAAGFPAPLPFSSGTATVEERFQD